MQFDRLLTCLCFSTSFLIAAALPVYAAPVDISLINVAETEVPADIDGVKTLKRIPATIVPPSGEVIYTTTFRNISDHPVGNIVITNAVPQDTFFVANSAAGSNTEVSYSLNGKRYDKPENLEVSGAHGKGRPAIASDYSNIRWAYKGELPAGKSDQVSFRVKVR
jgi:uncharacterized repeat protein (TIGR01451 family)